MNESIIEIKEVCNEKPSVPYSSASGFAIKTNKQVIKLLIDDEQFCCEHFGYFMSEDDLDRFVGSDILDISITDTALNTKKLEEHDVSPNDRWFEGGILFVNISTSNGLLQFVAYNEHNGYYGHDAYVISEQLNHELCL